ncbi:MAG TPA: 3-deoxy-D-manno-octulosonic acid transferase, partial [Bacteroidia bacterium]|nr:3-deoxy-D-manno-octulosonic acid transferase [Bacteroidia bacterium]
GWFRKQLNMYRKIFLQDADSEKLLKGIAANNSVLAGDTRFDRVIDIAEQAKTDAVAEAFKGNSKLWICGSTWEEDERIILCVYKQLVKGGEKLKLLIVPHEIGEKHINQVAEQFKAKKYSEVKAEEVKDYNELIIDKMGMLSSLYKYADIAYVGGGFGKNIHNLPEAAVFGVPVVFGPNHHKFTEAIDLIKLKGGFTINNESELLENMKQLLKDVDYCKKAGANAKAYIYKGSGATGKIITELEKIATA